EIGLVEPLGKDTLLYFEHGAERPTIAVVEGSNRFSAGDRMGLTIPPGALYLFDTEGKRVRPAS
ncbi:MAG: TOBE domain-containing protein, partial [bacterium]